MYEDLNQRIQILSQWFYESKYPVVFTVAGISTESGLPDFRGPDGVWTRLGKGIFLRPMSVLWHEEELNAGHIAVLEV